MSVNITISTKIRNWKLRKVIKYFMRVGEELSLDPYYFLFSLYLGQYHSSPWCHLHNFRDCILVSGFLFGICFCFWKGFHFSVAVSLFSFITSIFSFISLSTLIITLCLLLPTPAKLEAVSIIIIFLSLRNGSYFPVSLLVKYFWIIS